MIYRACQGGPLDGSIVSELAVLTYIDPDGMVHRYSLICHVYVHEGIVGQERIRPDGSRDLTPTDH